MLLRRFGRVSFAGEELPEDPIQRAWVDEGHLAMGAGSRPLVDEDRLRRGQCREVAGQVFAAQADVVQPFACSRLIGAA